MAHGIQSIKLMINRRLEVALPLAGLDVTLYRTEFDLTTSDFAGRRKFYKTQRFELPVTGNEEAIQSISSGKNDAKLYINGILTLSGYAIIFGRDDLGKTVTLGLISEVKSLVDYLGDNILYMDKFDFSAINPIVPTFSHSSSTNLLKYAQYKPIDKNTGDIELLQSNLDDYCQPSLVLTEFFKLVFAEAGWTANWGFFDAAPYTGATIVPSKIVWTPTSRYLCSSFGGSAAKNSEITIPANSSVKINLQSSTWNINGDSATFNADNTISVLRPARNMTFKILGEIFSEYPLTLFFGDGTEEFLSFDIIDQALIRQYCASIDPQLEGLDPIYIELRNDNAFPVTAQIKKLQVYNLFSVYENDQYTKLSPQGYYYPIADNYPDVTILDTFRQFCSQFQIAFRADEEAKNIEFYYINSIINGAYGYEDLTDRILWDGYVAPADALENSGVAKFNSIKYKDGEKNQSFFKVNLDNLPAKGVYFESFFGLGTDDKTWAAMCVPNLEKKVKLIANVPVSYLNYKDTNPLIGYFSEQSATEAKVLFDPISMTNISRQFWANIITLFTSAGGKNPNIFQLTLQADLYTYLFELRQNVLFNYQNNKCVLMGGEYSVLTGQFSGKFLTLR